MPFHEGHHHSPSNVGHRPRASPEFLSFPPFNSTHAASAFQMQLKPTTAHGLGCSRLSPGCHRPQPRLLKSHPNWSPGFPSCLRLVWFPYQRGSLKLSVISHYFPHLEIDQGLPVTFGTKPECLPGLCALPRVCLQPFPPRALALGTLHRLRL